MCEENKKANAEKRKEKRSISKYLIICLSSIWVAIITAILIVGSLLVSDWELSILLSVIAVCSTALVMFCGYLISRVKIKQLEQINSENQKAKDDDRFGKILDRLK